ncbi:hypothetical protein HJC23_006710 [Cyclotella cryptica]|uniref:CCT domain-containing protein n=1 Tax=Cyclotella cryptica TaxID=29204 RepID=A0ABD3NZH9_9STRA|eukprot:CCRYP_018862-RA/>CCRYP_018862-RA protein AED:0.15 eAED:0.26 QI:0/0/0/1/1/1/2/0/529
MAALSACSELVTIRESSTSSNLESSSVRTTIDDMTSSTEFSHNDGVSIDDSQRPPTYAERPHLITSDPSTSLLPATASVVMSDESTHDALDALAALASGRATVPLSHDSVAITPHQTDDDDSNSMPPPPPREPLDSVASSSFYGSTADESALLRELPAFPTRLGRLRSASNPEGMEKWDSYSRRNDRQHFVLPSSILEEELASTRRVLGENVEEDECGDPPSIVENGFQFTNYSYYDRGNVQEFTMLTGSDKLPVSYSTAVLTRKKRQIKQPLNYLSTKVLGTSPDSVADPPSAMKHSSKKSSSKKKSKSPELDSGNSSQNPEVEEDDDESLLEPEELLRRARSRLLEDLSEGAGVNGEKGVLTLPHSLSKYKEVYNKHGRIGIYTPAERAAIITKFNAKRARRVWNKKIRYNCRKNLADRRMRIKGRFVKRSVEAVAVNDALSSESDGEKDSKMECKNDSDKISDCSSQKGRHRPNTPPTSGSPLSTVEENDEFHADDQEMPDVQDEEAGFSPTDDMPYRRTRRYTIT